MQSLQKTLRVAFVFITVVSILLTSHSMYIYFGAYNTAHSLRISIQGIQIEPSDNSRVFIRTTFCLMNPSEFALHVVYLDEELYLNEIFLTDICKQWYENPVVLKPFSNTTITIDSADIPTDKVSMPPRNWDAVMRFTIYNFPLRGRAYFTRQVSYQS